MNPLTQIKNTQKATLSEVRQGLSDSASWHAKFANSAYVFAGGLSFDLTEGDVLAVRLEADAAGVISGRPSPVMPLTWREGKAAALDA